MKYVMMAVVGLIVGIIARFVYNIFSHGAVQLNWIWCIVLGIAGSYVAGLAGRTLHPETKDQPFHPAGFVYSIIGAIVLIFVARLLHLM